MNPLDPSYFSLSLIPGMAFFGIALIIEAILRSQGRSFVNSASAVEWVVIGVIIALVAFVLFPVPSHGCKTSRHQECFTHVKQLGLGMLMYRQDSDDQYPPA